MKINVEKPRVFADFQNSDPQGRVRLNAVGTLEDLSRLGLVLQEGVEIVLYCSELETEGVVAYSSEEELWVAKVDWEKIRDRPVP
jgi:hypothetical protein